MMTYRKNCGVMVKCNGSYIILLPKGSFLYLVLCQLSLLHPLLKEKAELLDGYFRVNIDAQANLCRLPAVLKQYTPDMDHVPEFILHLGNDVDWEDGKLAFNLLQLPLLTFMLYIHRCCQTHQVMWCSTVEKPTLLENQMMKIVLPVSHER